MLPERIRPYAHSTGEFSSAAMSAAGLECLACCSACRASQILRCEQAVCCCTMSVLAGVKLHTLWDQQIFRVSDPNQIPNPEPHAHLSVRAKLAASSARSTSRQAASDIMLTARPMYLQRQLHQSVF